MPSRLSSTPPAAPMCHAVRSQLGFRCELRTRLLCPAQPRGWAMTSDEDLALITRFIIEVQSRPSVTASRGLEIPQRLPTWPSCETMSFQPFRLRVLLRIRRLFQPELLHRLRSRTVTRRRGADVERCLSRYRLYWRLSSYLRQLLLLHVPLRKPKNSKSVSGPSYCIWLAKAG
jgi:hypothetical protein